MSLGDRLEEQMDEWGCLRATEEDWEYIETRLKKNGIVSFPYSGDAATAFIITIAGPISHDPRLTMPWGGRIQNTYLVALRLRGANYFDFEGYISPHYVAEKLNIDNEIDAKTISQLLNEIAARL